MNRGGRPRHNSYNEFSFIFKKENGKSVALCQGCNQILKNTAKERLKSHRKICIIPENEENHQDHDEMDVDSTRNSAITRMSISLDNIVEKIPLNNNTIDKSLNLDISSTNEPESTVNSNKELRFASPSVSRQRKIKPYMDRINKAEKTQIDEGLSDLLFGCNIDPNIVKSIYFKNFIKLLRPAYIPPNAEDFLSYFLDVSYEKFLKRCTLNALTEGVLFLNTVTHENTSSILSITRDFNGNTTFLKSFSTTGPDDKTILEPQEIITQAIDIARTKYNLEICAVLSKDATSLVYNNSKVWLLVCNVTFANDVGNSITDISLYNNACKIYNECLNRNLFEYLNYNVIELLESESTLWLEHFKTYFFYKNNVQVLRKIIVDLKHKFSNDITKLLFCDVFETEVTEFLKCYELLSDMIKKFGSKDYSIADSCEDWLNLNCSENILLLSGIDRFWTKIKHRVSMTANFLHPKYRGLKLCNEDIKEVNNFFFENLSNIGLDQVILYKEKKSVFRSLFEKNVDSPKSFWGFAESECQELALFAKKILQIPACTIELKSKFHTRRNLSNEKFTKLSNLFYDLRIRDSEQLSTL